MQITVRSRPLRMTPTPRAVLAFIIRFKREHDGTAPCVREIQQAVGLSTVSAVTYNLQRLERMGLIARKPGVSRCIVVKGGCWTYQEAK